MSLRELFDSALPINRKERFFTGTVFPMIVCCDNFKHFGRFLELAGLTPRTVDASAGSASIQFFTEYGFAESRFPAKVRDRFPDFVLGRDTPDILAYIEDRDPLLVAVEAKMYDVPDRPDLDNQLSRQEELLLYLEPLLKHPQIAQVALLPGKLASRMEPLSAPIVTWEDLADAYEGIAPEYFIEMLRIALDGYDDLVSRPPDRLLGREILAHFEADKTEYLCMGRQGGLAGPALTEDISTGRWAIKAYSCRPDPEPPNANWFRIADFVERLKPETEGTQ